MEKVLHTSLTSVMEDEGYTSPQEDLDSSIKTLPPESLDESNPYHGNSIQSWDDLRIIRKTDEESPTTRFLSDNDGLSTDFLDRLWKLVPPANESGSVEVIKSSFKLPDYISLSDFMSHVIHLLNGRESHSFIFVPDDQAFPFKRNPFILVKGLTPTALDNYSQKFIQFGGMFKRLWKIYQNELLLSSGTLLNTFLKGVGDYLKIFETMLMVNGHSLKTLTQVTQFIGPFHHQLQILDKIVTLARNKSSVTLLSKLNRLVISNEIPYVFDLLTSLFTIVASTYMRYISDWIFRGDLNPEFHIRSRAEVVVKDRRFWTRQFEQYIDPPLFIEDSTNLILETGKSIYLFNIINSSAATSQTYVFSNEMNEIVSPCFSLDELAKLKFIWETKVKNFLSKNAHLTHEVNDTLLEIVSTSLNHVVVDLGSSKSTTDLTEDIRRMNNLSKKRARQREFRLSLQEQVDESKMLKAAEALRDRMEDERILAYHAKKERKPEEHTKSSKECIHVEDSKITLEDQAHLLHDIGVIHVKAGTHIPFSAKASTIDLKEIGGDGDHKVQEHAECLQRNSKTQWSEQPLQDTSRRHDLKSKNRHRSRSVPPQTSEAENLDVVDSLKRRAETPIRITTRKRDYNKKSAKTIEEIFAFKQVNKDQVAVTSCSADLEDQEKLDPEKFILTKSDPIPDFNPKIFNEKPKGVILSKDEANSRKLHDPLDASSLNLAFGQSVSIPLRAQHRMVNTALVHYFVHENKLYHHLAMLNEFFLLQNGKFGQTLTNLLIQEVYDFPVKSRIEFGKRIGKLNLLLNEALSITFFNQDINPLASNLSFTLLNGQNRDVLVREFEAQESGRVEEEHSSEFNVLNVLRLKHVVDWPLNIILTDEMIRHFECLSGIFMQLSRSEQLLDIVFMLLKSKRPLSKEMIQLQSYRHRLHFFVRSMRFYMNVTIVHRRWAKFCMKVHQWDSLQLIYDNIVCYVREISHSCFHSLGLQGPGSHIQKLIIRGLCISDNFCAQLMRISDESSNENGRDLSVSETEFKSLRTKYNAAMEYQKLALKTLFKASNKRVYSKIEAFLEFYNFNNFYEEFLAEEMPFAETPRPTLLKMVSAPVHQSRAMFGFENTAKANTATSFYM